MTKLSVKPQPEPLWTGKEAAEYLRVPYATLRYWAYMSTGPRSYKVGRYRMYRISELETWLQEHAS